MKELNLDNPIFVIYLDVSHMSTQKADESMYRIADRFNYLNATTWVLASDKTLVECVYDGSRFNNRVPELKNLLTKINQRVDILSKSATFEDFNMHIRDWRLEYLLEDESKS